MIQFTAIQSKLANKDGKKLFYARSLRSRATITTRRIAEDVAGRSGASKGDVIGILMDLGEAMRIYLANGDRVKLDGIGSFALAFSSKGKGVDNAEDVNAEQFNRVRVLFYPETMQARVSGIRHSPLIDPNITFMPLRKADATQTDENSTTPTEPTPQPDNGGSSDDNL